MRAFESSPVHCVKFRPCLNLRSPGKGGANAILFQGGETHDTWQRKLGHLPAVNLIDCTSPTCNATGVLKILTHPFNEVVLEDTLD